MKKKLFALAAVLVLCAGMFALTGCNSKDDNSPYSSYDLSEYITLPDYDQYTTSEPVVEITDEDIDAEIQSRLENAKTTETIEEGTVEKGDKVNIAYKGTLEDGTTSDNMESDSFDLTLGEASMIDGFQEGLYGATIGEPVTLNLKFPDPYEVNEDLSGKKVTFVVTVNNKQVEVVPEFNAEFIKNNSDVETEVEYRNYVKAALEQAEYDNQLYDLKYEIYSSIVEDTEVIKYPETEVAAEIETINATYQSMATNYNYEWEDFLTDYFQMTQEEYDEEIELYAQQVIKQEMIIYAIADKEKISVSDKDYDEYLKELLEESGFEDEDAFEAYAGVSLKEYAEQYNLKRDLLLTNELDKIYDKLEKTK